MGILKPRQGSPEGGSLDRLLANVEDFFDSHSISTRTTMLLLMASLAGLACEIQPPCENCDNAAEGSLDAGKSLDSVDRGFTIGILNPSLQGFSFHGVADYPMSLYITVLPPKGKGTQTLETQQIFVPRGDFTGDVSFQNPNIRAGCRVRISDTLDPNAPAEQFTLEADNSMPEMPTI